MRIIRPMGLSHTDRVDSASSPRAGAEDAGAVADVLIRSRRAAAGAIPGGVHSDDEVREWIGAVVVPEREVRLTEEAPDIRFVWTAA
jgi:hypothetical protein